MKKYMYISGAVILALISGMLFYNHNNSFQNYLEFLNKNLSVQKNIVSPLPAEMPPDFSFKYYRGGGMSQRFIKIEFGTSSLKIQEEDDAGKETIRAKPLTLEIRQKTYQILRGLNLEKITIIDTKEPEYDGESTSFKIITKANQYPPDIDIQLGGGFEMTQESIPIYRNLMPIIEQIKTSI